jgi:hypothetical protein
MDNVELAQEHLEHAQHQAAHGTAHETRPETKWGAILVAVLASVAVLVEMRVNDAMITYLSDHISASDAWTQYQAKSVRRALYQQSAAALDAAGPAAAPRAEAARREAERMQTDPGHDGMEQLTERAHGFEEKREHELHLHEGLERGARGLQIAIVLVGLAMATSFPWLLWGGAALGGVSALYALVAGLGLI